jgi:putative endonuclease
MIYVYAISSLNKNYIYVGQTDHVIRRFHEHNNGMEKTTRPYLPFELINSWECKNRKEARLLEKYYKSGSGKRILKSLRNW